MSLIVEYVISEHETEVEVVPSSWYSSGQCWWPPGAFARSTLEKKVAKSVDCDEATWDCYEARLIATFKTYTEAKAKLPLAVEGELVAPSSNDNEGIKKGKGKRVKQKTRRYLTEETSESSDNEMGKNKESSQKKKKKRSPERPSQTGIEAVKYFDKRLTLPPDPNGLDIGLLSSSQYSNEVSHVRETVESTYNERSNLFDGGNGVLHDSMSSFVNLHSQQQLVVARKSTPSPTPTSPEIDSKKLGFILQRVESLAMGIEVLKANQREMLDMLTLLLKNCAPSQPDLPSITELFLLPMKNLDDVTAQGMPSRTMKMEK